MILEVKDMTYAYRTRGEKIILDHVSQGFCEGTFYTIVGPSGAGKTTFLSLLAGLDQPQEGYVLYQGEDIRKKGLDYHRRHHISLVFQNYNLIDYLTAEENVRLGGKGDAGELLTQVGILKEDWKRSVLRLSGGQQQRVAIARAMASEAKVLLADEPTGNLDEDTAKGIIRLLKRMAKVHGKCVIVVTHSRHLAEEADAVIQIRDGKIAMLDRRTEKKVSISQ